MQFKFGKSWTQYTSLWGESLVRETLTERPLHPPCELSATERKQVMPSASTGFLQNPHPFPHSTKMSSVPTIWKPCVHVPPRLFPQGCEVRASYGVHFVPFIFYHTRGAQISFSDISLHYSDSESCLSVTRSVGEELKGNKDRTRPIRGRH